ncbi:hypothetical protein [Burkholderia pseudomallei]|uniref:hypothetical protein n=1 Tax=Burkholderia pseudomallei TaxID=28450 RepID=UPI0004F66479|nr:hypothetical protein [Burkholderia pseudomallei]AIP15091.1 hypothetical protein DP60_3423 [Burkholderia pseudomallei]AJX07372.1 hypothetical protein BBW_2136 [Burkholderia pseudomallei 1026b]CAJ2803798.1 Uncharacterised protein [Burkholderia pseudomallei]CAJ2848740.1 Uncharacterised protein [Burkholderia pseudomallei]CAJ3321872.1 Uncharacterised protein [Burkholderia pseudomallei]
MLLAEKFVSSSSIVSGKALSMRRRARQPLLQVRKPQPLLRNGLEPWWWAGCFCFMASWEIQVAVIAIQVVIWALSNDDLQNAMLDSVFGMERKYKVVADLKRQDEAFDKALVAVGFKSEETDEKGKAGQNG